jgi:hypothetical protein
MDEPLERFLPRVLRERAERLVAAMEYWERDCLARLDLGSREYGPLENGSLENIGALAERAFPGQGHPVKPELSQFGRARPAEAALDP